MRIGRAVATAGFAFAALALSSCDRVPWLCRDEIVAGTPSPDGARIAETVVRDCHRTAGYTVHIELRATRGGARGETVAVLDGAKAPDLAWRGPRHLVLTPPLGVRVISRRSGWNDVTVAFERPPAGSNSGLPK
jgi:hypothetical protein